MHALGITPAEASESTGCSIEAVRSGSLEPGELEKLANHLGVALDWFYGERPEMDEGFLFLRAVVTAGPDQLKLRGKALPASDLPRELARRRTSPGPIAAGTSPALSGLT